MESDRAAVERQLGRPPRAFSRVVVRCPFGHPAVTEQHAFDDNGGSATVSGLVVHIGSKRSIKATIDSSVCPGAHPGLLVRATATGAVRSNAVK